MMTLLFVVQIVVLMFVPLVVDLLANTNDITAGPKHSQQQPSMIGTVSSAWIPYSSVSLKGAI